MKRSTFAAALFLQPVVMALAPSRPAWAGDTFEIQVYDGTANAPGVSGLELHLNDWTTGRRQATSPEQPLHGQVHATLEPSLGVLPGWELGAYLQGALMDDGTVRWAGAKLRSKLVTTAGFSDTWRLGLNLEVSSVPETFEADRWGMEIRPIVAWVSGPWLVAFNPILDQSFAGDGASDGPSFEPALKATRAIGPVALGLEYYGTIGPVAGPLALRNQDHMIFEVADLVSLPHVEVNAGIGEGLTPASAGLVLKVIVGYTFDP
jgi:hypothetical protein